MSQLPEEKKAFIRHFHRNGLTPLEIAHRMGLKPGDVKRVTAPMSRPAAPVKVESFAPAKWVQNILTTCIRRNMSAKAIKEIFEQDGHRVSEEWVKKAVKHMKGDCV